MKPEQVLPITDQFRLVIFLQYLKIIDVSTENPFRGLSDRHMNKDVSPYNSEMSIQWEISHLII